MSRFYQGLRISTIVLFVGLSSWGGQWFVQNFFRADRFVFQFDGALCCAQKERIKRFFHQDEQLRCLSLSKIANHVQAEFPSVAQITLVQNAAGVVGVNMKSVLPTVVINNDFVTTQDGALFRACLFDDKKIATLATCTVAELDQTVSESCDENLFTERVGTLPQELLTTVHALTDYLFERYTVSCQDKACWQLQDKKQKNFFVLFNGTKLPDEQMITACNTIKGTLCARGQLTTNSRQAWVADARFEDQIILFRKKAGGR